MKPGNGNDHQAGTSDHPFLKDAQTRLRVHRIVILVLLLQLQGASLYVSLDR